MSSVQQHTLYGEYNWKDPIYKVLRRETTSPRFKIFLMKKGVVNPLFYQYTDFLAMKLRGGGDLDDLMRKQRRMLVDEGVTTDANEKMKHNFTQGTPYTDLEEDDFHHAHIWCG